MCVCVQVRWLAEEASSSAQIISSLIGKPTQEARCCPHCNGQQKINVLLAEDAAELAEVCLPCSHPSRVRCSRVAGGTVICWEIELTPPFRDARPIPLTQL